MTSYSHYSHGNNNNNNNPYLTVSAVPGSQLRPMDRICESLDRCGNKVGKATRETENFVSGLWQHIRLSPTLSDAAMAKLAQGTKLLVEGGHERIFHQTFQFLPGEKLVDAFACYLSTSTGPVIGTLYISNQRIAFCSDYPLSHRPSPGREEYVYYKVVLHLHQLAAVNPIVNRFNSSGKYIHVLTVDGYDFSFMGFISYDKALNALNDAVQHGRVFHESSTRFIHF